MAPTVSFFLPSFQLSYGLAWSTGVVETHELFFYRVGVTVNTSKGPTAPHSLHLQYMSATLCSRVVSVRQSDMAHKKPPGGPCASGRVRRFVAEKIRVDR